MYSVTNRCRYNHDEKQAPFDKDMRARQAEAQKKVRQASKTEQQDSKKRGRNGHQSRHSHHERESREQREDQKATSHRERQEVERQDVAQYEERRRARLEKERQEVLRAEARREEREAQIRLHEPQQDEHYKKRDIVEQQGEQASNTDDWNPHKTLAEAASDTSSFAEPEPSEEEDDDRAAQETTKSDRTERKHVRNATQKATISDFSERKTYNLHNGKRDRKRDDRDRERSSRGNERDDRDRKRSRRGSERDDRGRERSSRDSERGDRDKGKSNQDRERADRDNQERRAGDQGREDANASVKQGPSTISEHQATASVKQGLSTMSEHRATTTTEQKRNTAWRSKVEGSPRVVRKLGYEESGNDEPKQATKRTLVLQRDQTRMRGERALEAMRKGKPMPNFGRITLLEAITMVPCIKTAATQILSSASRTQ